MPVHKSYTCSEHVYMYCTHKCIPLFATASPVGDGQCEVDGWDDAEARPPLTGLVQAGNCRDGGGGGGIAKRFLATSFFLAGVGLRELVFLDSSSSSGTRFRARFWREASFSTSEATVSKSDVNSAIFAFRRALSKSPTQHKLHNTTQHGLDKSIDCIHYNSVNVSDISIQNFHIVAAGDTCTCMLCLKQRVSTTDLHLFIYYVKK